MKYDFYPLTDHVFLFLFVSFRLNYDTWTERYRNCVSNIIASGIIPAGMEMMDKALIHATDDFVKAGYPRDAESMLIVELDGTETEVEELIENIKGQIKDTKNSNLIIKHEKRLARLSAKVAIVKVGANSKVELKEKRDRAEDAIYATKAALKEGIVPGGGVALMQAALKISIEGDNEDQNAGIQLLKKACEAPFRAIMENGGLR